MSAPDTRHGRIYDTVLVTMPASHGAELTFFRDLTNKSESLTNLLTARRIRANNKAKISQIGVDFTHWSGDDMLPLLRKLGHLHVTLNHRLVLSLPLRDLWVPFKVDCEIEDDDDINCKVTVGSTPWDAPSEVEWKESIEVVDEQLLLPGPLARLNPVLRRSLTTLRPVSRPKQGSYLVTVYLEGDLTEPIGK